MPKTLLSLLIFVISTLIALAVVELVVRKWWPQPTLSSLRTNNFNCYTKSDLLSFTLKPNCTATQASPEFSVVVNTNSLGYRDDEFNFVKSPDTIRILILGDSFTFGYGVDQNTTFPQQLEQHLNQKYPTQKIEIINAGFVAGFSPDSYYVFLREHIQELSPDLVIIALFTLNDITDLDLVEWHGQDQLGLPQSITDKNRKIINGFLVDKNSYLGNFHSLTLASKTLRRLKNKLIAPRTALDYYLCIFTNQCFPEANELFVKTNTVLNGLKSLTNDLIIVLLPADVQIDDTAWEKYDAGKFGLNDPPYPQTRLLEITTAIGIPTLDLLPEFLAHRKEKLFFQQDGHFTPRGHELTAQILSDYLSQNFFNHF